MKVYDFVIIGSGVGASAFLNRIADTGADILVLERGDFLQSEEENWNPDELFRNNRYRCKDDFIDRKGMHFTPRMYYNVGGNSKVFGASSYRFREQDFEETVFPTGTSIGWPIAYKELEPYYDIAEKQMHVCGRVNEDPTEPNRRDYNYPPYEHEEYIAELSEKLKALGLHPFHLPVAINTDRCRKGSACDGYPCRIKAKHDAEVAFLRPVIQNAKNVKLQRNSYVTRLEIDESSPENVIAGKSDKISYALVEREGREEKIYAKQFILAAGAINSALLLLRSCSPSFPNGLANSSDQVGRNYMSHINSVIIAINFFKKNPTRFQKTLALNDFYLECHPQASRLGSIQMRGKIKPANLYNHKNILLRWGRNFFSSRSADFWLMTEDFAKPQNRVYYDDYGKVHLDQNLDNLISHKELVRRFSRVLKKLGYHWVYFDLRRERSVQHQCGTIRFGLDHKKFPLDKYCKAYDLENLHVVDASVFPSSAALNPALTVAANSMRVADHIKKELKRSTYEK